MQGSHPKALPRKPQRRVAQAWETLEELFQEESRVVPGCFISCGSHTHWLARRISRSSGTAHRVKFQYLQLNYLYYNLASHCRTRIAVGGPVAVGEARKGRLVQVDDAGSPVPRELVAPQPVLLHVRIGKPGAVLASESTTRRSTAGATLPRPQVESQEVAAPPQLVLRYATSTERQPRCSSRLPRGRTATT